MARYCNRCNSEIEEGGNFCTDCGSNDIRDTSNAPSFPNVDSGMISEIAVPEGPASEENVPVAVPEVVGANAGVVPISNSGTISNEVSSNIVAPTPVANVSVGNNSFADIPDFMNSQNNNIVVPSGFDPQLEANSNTPVTNSTDTAMKAVASNSAISEKRKAIRKRNKRRKIIATSVAIVGCLLIAGLVGFLYIYGSSDNTVKGFPFSEEEDKGKTGKDTTSLFNADNAYRVGNESFGYVSIPNTWHNFKDNNGNSTLQYTDGSWIVTIYAVPTSNMTAANWANRNYTDLTKKGLSDIKASTTTISGYNAFVISAYMKDSEKYFTMYFFESKSGKTHYLCLEGPSDSGDTYNIIYSFLEDK